ncbi:MAG: tetratricopeptide repeat protein [Planctomycetes bacterium]|nr:tetratricopeptide repeat protein [Planctomycetota bacterium]
MVKKLLILLPILSCILLSGMMDTALAGSADQLKQAETYQEQGQYGQAEGIYQQILTDDPGTDHAFRAQKNLAMLYVTWDRQTEAEAALQKLLADFSEHEVIATAVTNVADTCRKWEKHQKACEIYQYVVSNWPADEHGMWSQMGLVISNINLGNNDIAETAFEKLRTDYSENGHISRAVCLVADAYRRLEKDEDARNRYQYALKNWPDAEFALWSQMGLAISSIRFSDSNTADLAADKLRADFSEDERIPIAVCMVADEYRKFNKFEKAREYYQYVVSNWPDAEHALWSQMGLAISNIQLADYDSAQVIANKLRADFSDDERMSRAGCLIADEYRRIKKHEKACELYQYVVDSWPDTEFAMWSQMGLAISKTSLYNDNGAAIAAEKLPVNYSKRTNLPLAVFQIGESYYNQAFLKESEGNHAQTKVYLQKAITEWEKIITQLPKSITTAWAYNFAADCYRRLGQHKKAIEYYQRVVDDWPDYEYASDALFRIGHIHENLKTLGITSKSEADLKIKAIYEQLLEKYPDCRAARIAQRWLTSHK